VIRRLTLSLALLLICSPLSAQQKKRIAVLDFDYSTVYNYVSAIFGTDQDVGRGVADMLVDRLVKSGKYSIIERKALDKVLAEQNFSNSDRADSSTAAKIGRILGVDAILIGSITQFGRDDQVTNIGGLGAVAGRWGIGGFGKRKAKAVVQLTARLVDTTTAEILAVAQGKGESKRSGTTLLGSGGGSATVGGGGVDMSSVNFAATLIGEAVNKAVDEVAQQIDAQAGKLPTRKIKIDGLVADVAGNTLILNVGTRAGVKVGDKLEIRRLAREVKDPATGRVLRRITEKVGEVTITDADEISSVGTFTGAATPKVGDMVTNSP